MSMKKMTRKHLFRNKKMSLCKMKMLPMMMEAWALLALSNKMTTMTKIWKNQFNNLHLVNLLNLRLRVTNHLSKIRSKPMRNQKCWCKRTRKSRLKNLKMKKKSNKLFRKVSNHNNQNLPRVGASARHVMRLINLLMLLLLFLKKNKIMVTSWT